MRPQEKTTAAASAHIRVCGSSGIGQLNTQTTAPMIAARTRK